MTIGKWCVIRGYKRVDFDWVVESEIIRYDPFLIDNIHEDKKVRHDFQLFIRILMVDIVPIVIKELEQWSEKLKKDSTSWKAIDLSWKRSKLSDRGIERVKWLLNDLFAKIAQSVVLYLSILWIRLIVINICWVICIRIVNILSPIKIIRLLGRVIYIRIRIISLIDCNISLGVIANCTVLNILINRIRRSIITICWICIIKIVTCPISCIICWISCII